MAHATSRLAGAQVRACSRCRNCGDRLEQENPVIDDVKPLRWQIAAASSSTSLIMSAQSPARPAAVTKPSRACSTKPAAILWPSRRYPSRVCRAANMEPNNPPAARPRWCVETRSARDHSSRRPGAPRPCRLVYPNGAMTACGGFRSVDFRSR